MLSLALLLLLRRALYMRRSFAPVCDHHMRPHDRRGGYFGSGRLWRTIEEQITLSILLLSFNFMHLLNILQILQVEPSLFFFFLPRSDVNKKNVVFFLSEIYGFHLLYHVYFFLFFLKDKCFLSFFVYPFSFYWINLRDIFRL